MPFGPTAVTVAWQVRRYASSRNSCFMCRPSWLAPLRHPVGTGKVLGFEELRVEQLARVARARIRQDGDDHMPGTQLFGEAYRPRDVDAARPAEAQPLV